MSNVTTIVATLEDGTTVILCHRFESDPAFVRSELERLVEDDRELQARMTGPLPDIADDLDGYPLDLEARYDDRLEIRDAEAGA